ncbi:MAG TPA: WYL domain-containing protein [Naasia sp.]
MAEAVPVEERLFSLVLALVATEHGLTKAEILGSVQGYRQRYKPGGDNASLERQFERDKDDIRELGVPLETIEPLTDPGNNQLLRYRIPKGAYDLPADVTFTPEETTLLNLAAEVWREGSLSSESHRALLKLRSLGVEVDDPTIGYAPRIRMRESAFEPLRQAIAKHVVVRFPYLKPGFSEATERTVEPHALVQHEGRWHLASRDVDRDQPRTFLLSRIVGPVVASRTSFEPPAADVAGETIAELTRILREKRVRIRVEPGSDAEVRLRRRAAGSAGAEPAAGTGEFTLHYTDVELIADDLASFGPEVLVLEPAEVRDAVRARLLAVLDAHAEERR